MRALSRTLIATWIVSVAVAGLVGFGSARASAAADPRQFVPGVFALGGSVTGPGLATPRPISADNAGRFMQAWLPYSIVSHPANTTPPAGATVYHVAIRQQFHGATTTI